ncbi:MAG: hypothetical protein HKM89_06120, partial [Gemmatimonadales bacterium]|nr:hypothetical protein [Gemmatimonadales bacterium]
PLNVAEFRELLVAERQWAARSFDDYAFVTRQSCFCSPEVLLQVEVEVRGGTITSVTDVVTDTLVRAELYSAWYTVEDVFERIRRAGGVSQVADVVVAFDPVLGYPTSFATQFDQSILDAGGSIEITALHPIDPAPAAITELAPAFPYADWFTQHTGYPAHADNFGVYSMEPFEGTLYLGFGAAAPAQSDGSLLAEFDNGGLRPIGPLDEQGFLDMMAVGDTLLIPGVDPCCPDDWDAGNFYTYTPSAGLTKYRNIPNVLHTWRVWHEPSDGAIYVVTGSHRGDFATWTGEIWRSTDYGVSWSRFANYADGVGDFRTNDIVRHHNRFYAISAAYRGPCELVVEPSAGAPTWAKVIPGQRVACHHALVIFGDDLIALDATRDGLHVIPQTGALAGTVALPFTVGTRTFNWATLAGSYLFAVSDDGQIWRSQDALSWEAVASGNREFVSIGYWPHRSWLLLASSGVDGAVWKLRLCGAEPC